ncbi:hypothetical protein LOK49_LG12G00732 [Camellia lanceoleosa]|uniref:Uncharacterized protein n=1 Tax=Camellia lanceoleosa TaxID=1840588 RepID=A0ACC0FU03_9ERIC|nr:hypothetical protein LOK49_LG12G00732 [Camellia lanceoleosa]
MASITMTTASFHSVATTKPPSTTGQGGRSQGVIMAKASKVSESVSFKNESNENNSSSSAGRRDLVFAAAAAAAALWSVAKVAVADEPQRGTPEAKKKYAPVCVTMPTARICRK